MQKTELIRKTGALVVGEIGIAEGRSSEEIARELNGRGELHLFDFQDKVDKVTSRLNCLGFSNVIAHGNSRKLYDDYNWSLMKLLRDRRSPMFDYVYLDGAHTWHHDALAFFLIDRLLCVGGYLELDDFNWTHASSPTVNPQRHPVTGEQYTDEQIHTAQVKLIADLLIEPSGRYQSIVEHRVYQKLS